MYKIKMCDLSQVVQSEVRGWSACAGAVYRQGRPGTGEGDCLLCDLCCVVYSDGVYM